VIVGGRLTGAGGGFLSRLLGKKHRSDAEKAEDEKTFNQHASQLTQRTEQITSGLSQIGLRAVALNNDELTELLYNLYNPEAVEKKDLNLAEDKANKSNRSN